MRQLSAPVRSFLDWEGVQHALAQAYFPHAMLPKSPGASLSSLDMVDLGSCRVTHMSLGATVTIRTDHPGAYAINIPLTGRLDSIVGGKSVEAVVGEACVCPPDTLTVIPEWETSCRLLGFKIDRQLLDREYGRVLGRRPQGLPHLLDLQSRDGRAWLSMLRSVADHATRNDAAMLQDPRYTTQISNMLVTGLLLAAVPEDRQERSGTRPRVIRRVIDAIEDDPARPWSPGEMADLAGVSVRRLQQAFREYHGLTPFQHLHEVRIERAHRDLLDAPNGATVTDIAMRWGLTHMGRFAADYRRRFGQNPSETLIR
ncbi:MAG: AraC family transcriptional regulator [Microcella sp.]